MVQAVAGRAEALLCPVARRGEPVRIGLHRPLERGGGGGVVAAGEGGLAVGDGGCDGLLEGLAVVGGQRRREPRPHGLEGAGQVGVAREHHQRALQLGAGLDEGLRLPFGGPRGALGLLFQGATALVVEGAAEQGVLKHVEGDQLAHHVAGPGGFGVRGFVGLGDLVVAPCGLQEAPLRGVHRAVGHQPIDLLAVLGLDRVRRREVGLRLGQPEGLGEGAPLHQGHADDGRGHHGEHEEEAQRDGDQD
ncbi:MAG: hypothetical protein ACK559_26400, partial [bacterium]